LFARNEGLAAPVGQLAIFFLLFCLYLEILRNTVPPSAAQRRKPDPRKEWDPTQIASRMNVCAIKQEASPAISLEYQGM
jgi:hypothetical protein